MSWTGSSFPDPCPLGPGKFQIRAFRVSIVSKSSSSLDNVPRTEKAAFRLPRPDPWGPVPDVPVRDWCDMRSLSSTGVDVSDLVERPIPVERCADPSVLLDQVAGSAVGLLQTAGMLFRCMRCCCRRRSWAGIIHGPYGP